MIEVTAKSPCQERKERIEVLETELGTIRQEIGICINSALAEIAKLQEPQEDDDLAAIKALTVSMVEFNNILRILGIHPDEA